MSPRNADQNKLIRDERREQILNSALKVFSNRGFVATKISDIAKEASFSHGLVYHYFESKDEIFATLVERALQSSNQLTLLAAEKQGSSLDKIEWMTQEILRAFIHNEEAVYYHHIMLQASTFASIPESVKTQMQDISSPMKHMLQFIEDGQRDGIIRLEDAKRLATLYWSMIQGLALMKIEAGEYFSMPDTDMIVRLFK
ncbi:TetR/AcrR family transcriptional regulator [Paenibacillus sp. B1-33]|uniref:TetR/AcrR family transcriptional regulator n=1 Tax=unclassified Paenibacillus TaxID=185978 RepID=UPI003D27E26B